MRTTRLTAGLLSLVLLGGGLAACDEEAQEAYNAPGEAGESANTEEKVTGEAALSSQLPPGTDDISEDDAGTAATDESGRTAEAGEPKGEARNGDEPVKMNGKVPEEAVETEDMGAAGRSERVWEEEKDPVWTENKGSIEH